MYPISDPNKTVSRNPYIDKLIETIEENSCVVVNKGKISKYGVFDLLLYMGKVDIYYLNWIENLPDRRFGWIQIILFFFIFLILKLFGKKIIWMMHNKISHSKKGLLLKIVTNYMLVNYSDIVLTHSLDGVKFGNILLKNTKKIEFIHHPIENNIQKINNDRTSDIDILIWGSISPYKGVDTFLDYLQKSKISEKYKIHIVGKISNKELSEKLNSYSTDKIVIENDFVSTERLEELFSKSKMVLFTYAGYSTLSSGALMDTLAYNNHVIGPNVGAFRDLNEEGLIETFTDFNNLIEKFENGLLDKNLESKHLAIFIENNSWKNFGNWLCEIILNKSIKY
jgi:glycosyltransferase involved in cell wall biosynthesis